VSDGQIIIDTKLNSDNVEKDLNKIEKSMQNAGKQIETSMNKAEKSMQNLGKSFDGSKVAKQMQTVATQIDKTNQSIDKQKQKLDKLQESYSKATNQKQKDNISLQMDKATASVTKLESKLNGLKDKQINLKMKIDGANGLDGEFRSAEMYATKSVENIKKKVEEAEKSFKNFSIGENISKTGQLLSNVGDSFTRNVTAPVTLFGVAAAKVGMDFDSQMSRVKAISGATGEEFKKLHDQALQLGKDTAFSAKQAAEGMENLAAAGFNTNETMEAMPGLLSLAAASGESLASSSDIAASTLRGFGLEASQAGHVADVLAKNANATNAAVSDTGEAMKYIAPVAHSMGLSLEEVTAAIGEMANSGIKGSQAGTTLRSALTRLASPSKEAAGMMKQLGFNAFDSQGKLKPLATILGDLQKSTSKLTDQKKEDAIATIFGQEAMSGMMVLMQGGTQALDDLTNSYKSADGAANDMAKTMQDNAKSAIEQMGGSIETAAIKLEEAAAPAITNIANEVQDMANRFADLPEPVQESIIKAALFAAAIGPIAKTVGTITTGIGGLIQFGGRLATTLGILGEGAEVGGAALTAFSTAGLAAAGVASILAVGVAGAITYNELLNKSVDTSTDDLNTWEKAVNACTGGVVKSKAELQKAGLVYKDFGEGVGDSFKDGIEKATKEYHNFEMTITGANMDDKISTENQSKLTGQINSMIEAAKSSINSKKAEVKNKLTEMFTIDDGSISQNEQKVIDAAGSEMDAKISKVSEIEGKITDIWTKAIQEHGKLSQEDVKQIETHLRQIQQIKAEVEAENDAESDYAKNEYSERLKGTSLDDAASLYKDSSDEVKKKFEHERAVYKNGLSELQKEIKKFNDEGKIEEAKAAQEEYDAKDKKYKESLKKEQDYLKEYRDMLYKKNPSLEGSLNIVDGSKLTTKDKDQFNKLKDEYLNQYKDIANATESGMKRVQDSTGKWHDVYVEVDEATGQIISAYDTFNGEYAGYSVKFADNAKTAGDKVKAEMDKLKDNMLMGMKGLKLNDSNQVIKINADGTEETVTKLDKVITKIDGTKVAIANINGEQVKIEFNADGTIKNMADLLSAIKEHAKNSPAKVDVNVNDEQAMKDFEEVENEAALINRNKPEVEIKADIAAAKARLQEVQNALDRLKSKSIDVSIHYTGDEFSDTQQEQNYTRAIRKEMANRYTGTGGGTEGLSYVNEHGWEISDGSQEVAYLGSGSGIMDHMTSVNEMHNDITNQVGNSVGKVVNALISALGGQGTLLNQIVTNTAETVNVGEKGNQLNAKMATDLVNNLKANTNGTFSTLENEIVSANQAKEKADNMKVEDNKWYSSTKAEYDSVMSQIDYLRDKTDETTDENTKKQLEAQQKVLEKQKDTLDKEVNYYKDAAQKEIDTCKENAEEQVRIAEAKKAQLTQLAEATTTALKNEYEAQKKAAEDSINAELTDMEDAYNKKVKDIEDDLKNKTDAIDKKIKALEKQSTDNSRQQERDEANNNIFVLQNKIKNTASEADKRSFQLELEQAQKDLKEKEDTWNIEDQKQALEDEKTLLEQRADNRKKSLEEQYNQEKAEKEKELKDTDAYYDKLLEEDSINAQARYLLLQGNQDELVKLLQSYNPLWQDAGQSLADSLLTGLNSKKESIKAAVADILGAVNSSGVPVPSQYYDTSTGKTVGYASGTNYNQTAGLYNTNEQGFELGTNGDIAYIPEGAGIKNHMESLKYIDSEIASQVAMMKASIIQSNLDIAKSLGGMITKATNTNNNNTKIYQPILQIQEYNQYTNQDLEQISNEFGVMAYRQRTS
jgi:TP901 family phage tail tape measure protein